MSDNDNLPATWLEIARLHYDNLDPVDEVKHEPVSVEPIYFCEDCKMGVAHRIVDKMLVCTLCGKRVRK